jgi:hypothetical protein
MSIDLLRPGVLQKTASLFNLIVRAMRIHGWNGRLNFQLVGQVTPHKIHTHKSTPHPLRCCK